MFSTKPLPSVAFGSLPSVAPLKNALDSCLSFLSVKDLVQLSTASKKCRKAVIKNPWKERICATHPTVPFADKILLQGGKKALNTAYSTLWLSQLLSVKYKRDDFSFSIAMTPVDNAMTRVVNEYSSAAESDTSLFSAGERCLSDASSLGGNSEASSSPSSTDGTFQACPSCTYNDHGFSIKRDEPCIILEPALCQKGRKIVSDGWWPARREFEFDVCLTHTPSGKSVSIASSKTAECYDDDSDDDDEEPVDGLVGR